MNSSKVAVLIACLVLSSCSNDKPNSDKDPVYDEYLLYSIGPDDLKVNLDVGTKLAQAAENVSSSMEKLAKIEMASKSSTDHLPDERQLQKIPGMNTLSSVDWNGPIEPILQKISSAAKFKFRVIGRKQSIPVIIAVNMKNVPTADIIRNISYQAAGKAKIVFLASKNTMELRYIDI